MKLLKDLAQRTLGVEKRAGLYVSRPVLNADAWAKWAAEAGIPNAFAAADFHVTVCSSRVDVKTRPQADVFACWTNRAAIVSLGKALVVVFDAWSLHDRNCELRSLGALEDFCSYRPHLSLSYDADGFEISDEALAKMPETIILGAEVNAPHKGMAEMAMPDAETCQPILQIDVYFSAAEKALAAGGHPLLTEFALRDIVAAKAISKAAFAHLEGLDGFDAAPAVKGQTREREVVMTVRPLPAEMAKRAAAAELFKSDEEERLVWGWASVATVKGEAVVDLQGDTITVKAQRQFLHDLMRGQRAGKFEHVGKACNEIVEGMIFDQALQKALGIDLGMEGMLVVTHVPADSDWEMVKSGEWMYSIAGTVLVED